MLAKATQKNKKKIKKKKSEKKDPTTTFLRVECPSWDQWPCAWHPQRQTLTQLDANLNRHTLRPNKNIGILAQEK